MHGGRAGRQRFFRIGDRGQRLPIDLHQIGRVGGDVAVRRHHHGHRMAHEIHAIGRQNVMMRHAQAGQRRAARHRSDVFGVASGEHRDHALVRARPCDVSIDRIFAAACGLRTMEA